MSAWQSRTRASVLVAAFAVLGWAALTPGVIGAQVEPEDDQDGWDECMFGGEPGIGPCNPNAEHIFQGQCEGIDCYSELETCCQM